MAQRRSPKMMRRLYPRSKAPLARELAELGNILKSARLLTLADKVAALEHKAEALDNFMVHVSSDGKN